ncbi:hypothetical protein E2C01_058248 [Portunus trituberculatus]|uniref:Uncharacterized protein n=1 Tax=Portunus trituberculatus TaxID=210409 RepID=A0A5B7H2P2_PORTR|nr:hypothetical protein [Portunus trituberculatus]
MAMVVMAAAVVLAVTPMSSPLTSTRCRCPLSGTQFENVVGSGGVLEEVQKSYYLGDMLDCEAGAERAVRLRVAAAWGIW